MPKDEPDEIETTTSYSGGLQWWVPLKLGVERTVTKRWFKRAAQFGDEVSTAARMTTDQITARIDESEAVGDLVGQSIQRALESSDKPYIAGLAGLVAAGLKDDAMIEEVAYLLSILRLLEPVHLRVLRSFTDLCDEQIRTLGPTGQGQITEMVRLSTMAQALHLQRFVALSCAQRLVGLSLLEDTFEGSLVVPVKPDGSFDIDGETEQFHPTEMGRRLLDHCRRVAE